MHFYTDVAIARNDILIREVKNGKRVQRKVKYKPYFFLPTKDTNVPNPEYVNLKGEPLYKYTFENIEEAREFKKEVDGNPSNYNMIYGMEKFMYAWMSDTFKGDVDFDPDSILVVTMDIEVECDNGFPDPQLATERMLSITIKNQQTKEITVFGRYDYKAQKDNVVYIKCDDERHLLSAFLEFWTDCNPDIITGWNTEFFDVPYLVNRITKVLGQKECNKLSPWGYIRNRTIEKLNKQFKLYDIIGVANLDYYNLYRKFTYTSQESYKLDHIAFIELGDKKDDNPFETFKEWYTNDYQSFIDYNIQDVEIVDKLENKMKLIQLIVTMAYTAKVNYMDAFTSVKYWDIMIYNYLIEKGIVIPQLSSSGTKDGHYEGAYVKDPQVGMHKWVLSFDLNSLYPHLIMQYNISPETLVEGSIEGQDYNVDNFLNKNIDITNVLSENDITVTPRGTLFRTTERGFLPALMRRIYDDRVSYKRKMLEAKQKYEDTKDPKYQNDISRYNNIQMAKKISLNSAYGAIGNQYFRFYDLRIAEAITQSGQLSIRWIEQKINKYLNEIMKTTDVDYIIASDTDSIYIRFDELVNKLFDDQTKSDKIVNFLDTIAKEKIEPFIDKSYQELADYMNAFEQKMQMKREVIADKGIWTAKKRYILNAWDVEGVRYKEPTLKIMGIEAVKSSTPSACRQKIKEALRIIMNGNEDELNEFIQEFRVAFDKMPLQDISFPRSVSGITKYKHTYSNDNKRTKEIQKSNPFYNPEIAAKQFYNKDVIHNKSTPIHVKGALLYNKLIRTKKLEHKYPLIQEGDKIKYIKLITPNSFNRDVMCYITKFPVEFHGLVSVDYDTQFMKAFVDPLSAITDKLNWKLEINKKNTLESFFG